MKKISPTKKSRINWGTGVVIGIIVFVVVSITMTIIFMTQDVSLVSDNYYEKTLTYQNQIDEADRSKEIDKEIRLEYSGNQLKIVLPDSIAKDMNNGEVYFYRPSDSNMDFKIPLQADKNNELVLDASKIDKGYWKVQMKWLMKEERYSVERTVMIN